MINHFTFNGTSTAQLGLIVSGVSIFGAGSRKVEKAGIPGRNGDLQIELGGFNNYTVRYTVSITKNFTTTAQQIREWLLESKGYCDLTDTYHPDEIRKACFNSDIEFTTSMLYKYGQASIQFDCLPERYLTTNTPITTTATADTTTDTTMSLNTVPTPISIFLNGNTTQEGSSGKNLIPRPYHQADGTYQGVTWTTDNMGKITASGTTTAGTSFRLTDNSYFTLRAGTYTLSITGTLTGIDLKVYNGSAIIRTIVRGTTNGHTTFTLSSASGLRVYFNTGNTGDTINVSAYVQLEKGSTATAYEPHISPTNPQVIHNVSGDNTINVTSKNILSPFTVGIGLDANTGVERTASNTATTDFISVDFIAHPYYYISGLDATLHTYICAYNSYKQFLHRTGSTFRDNELLATSTFIGGTPQGIGDIAYLRVTYSKNSGDTGDINNVNNHLSQLEIGNLRTDFEPYTAQSYPLYLPVENYFDINTVYADTSHYTIDGDSVKSNYFAGARRYISSDLVGKALTFQAYIITNSTSVNVRVQANVGGSDKNGNYITAGAEGLSTVTFTPTSTSDYVRITYSDTGGIITAKNIQLEIGSKANHYTPYGTTPIELNKIGTYQDYIYKNGGKWYVHKAITKVDLGTLDSWNSYNDTFYANLVGAIIPSSGVASILCTSYRATSMASVISKLEDKAIALNTGQSRCNVYDSSYNASTIGNFINSVKGVWFYYPLATPTNTEITDTTLINQLNNIEKAYSYNGTTNILQVSNDNGFMLEVVSLHGSTFTSNYKGEPIITVNSTGLIYLNGEVMEVLSAPVTINCQTMQCYNGVVNMNNEVRVNDFPEIKIGANEVGSSMALTITPNNWRH